MSITAVIVGNLDSELEIFGLFGFSLGALEVLGTGCLSLFASSFGMRHFFISLRAFYSHIWLARSLANFLSAASFFTCGAIFFLADSIAGLIRSFNVVVLLVWPASRTSWLLRFLSLRISSFLFFAMPGQAFGLISFLFSSSLPFAGTCCTAQH